MKPSQSIGRRPALLVMSLCNFPEGSSSIEATNFCSRKRITNGSATTFASLTVRSAQKSLILQIALSSELQMLTQQLDRLAQKKRWSRDFTQHTLRSALRSVIASFPVYRTYVEPAEIRDADAKSVLRGVSRAMAHNPAISTSVFNFIRDTLLVRDPSGGAPDPAYQAEQHHFAGKFQQLTSPVMAKGVEDTAFYVYNRLLALNEVGGSPDQFGLAPKQSTTRFAAVASRIPGGFRQHRRTIPMQRRRALPLATSCRKCPTRGVMRFHAGAK